MPEALLLATMLQNANVHPFKLLYLPSHQEFRQFLSRYARPELMQPLSQDIDIHERTTHPGALLFL